VDHVFLPSAGQAVWRRPGSPSKAHRKQCRRGEWWRLLAGDRNAAGTSVSQVAVGWVCRSPKGTRSSFVEPGLPPGRGGGVQWDLSAWSA